VDLDEYIATRLLEELGSDVDPGAVERLLMERLTRIGSEAARRAFEKLSPTERFEDRGVAWSPAVSSSLLVMSLFGPLRIERTLFRARRNGPTRCLVSERLGLVDGLWTPEAARIGAMTIAEMPMERAAEFLDQVGLVRASRSSLLRLGGTLSEQWESSRAVHEQQLREGMSIPTNAVAVSVSLDGVMVSLVGSNRRAKRAAARARGSPDKGPAGQSEASVGVISFYCAQGTRLATRRYSRMPEAGKTTTKAWLRAELQHIRELRPDLIVVALADGAPDNWTLLESLQPDHSVVDFFHAAAHLHVHVSRACGAATLKTQRLLRGMRRQLLKDRHGAKKVFSELQRLREAAGTEAPSTRKTSGKRQPTFFDRHHSRMPYAELRSKNLPIGSGVTESTCKLAVCDRLRRTGMRWSIAGGQAILTLRVLRINGEFDRAFSSLMTENRDRMAA
jgi:hypothetical protein